MNRQQRRQKKQAEPKKATTAALDRLLLASSPERLSEDALLLSRLKLHSHLHTLQQQHEPACVRYMQHFLNHMRTMLLVQPRPPLDAWVVQAEAELAQSHTAAPRSFRWLKALVCRFDEDMGKTSAHLLLEANDHAAAVGVMGHILAIIHSPDRAADAIDRLLQGRTMAETAAEYGVGQQTIKAEVLELAHHLHRLSEPEGGNEAPATLTELRKHKQRLLDVLGNINNIARSAAGQIYDFHRLFGVSLIDIERLANLGKQKEAA